MISFNPGHFNNKVYIAQRIGEAERNLKDAESDVIKYKHLKESLEKAYDEKYSKDVEGKEVYITYIEGEPEKLFSTYLKAHESLKQKCYDDDIFSGKSVLIRKLIIDRGEL